MQAYVVVLGLVVPLVACACMLVYIRFSIACSLDAGLQLPLQLTPIRAPRFHGVCSTAVASYMEGLLVERSSLQSPASIFLSTVCLPQRGHDH